MRVEKALTTAIPDLQAAKTERAQIEQDTKEAAARIRPEPKPEPPAPAHLGSKVDTRG